MSLEISEEQALFFRARRSHLAGPGATDAATAAHDVLGGQAQVESTGLQSLAARTEGRPTLAALRRELFAEPRRLVRTWGQRDTVHIYATDDWAEFLAATPQWDKASRRIAGPDASLADAVWQTVRHLDEICREDLYPTIPSEVVEALDPRVKEWMEPATFVASRLLKQYADRGDLCIGPKRAGTQFYVRRCTFFPDLPWEIGEPQEAATRLARRYLACCGPATIQDAAHFFGAKVGAARHWLDALREQGEIVAVACGDRKALLALARDRDEISRAAPRSPSEWPLRLLPSWDTLLMGHADKSWTVPAEAERKAIWRRSAHNAPVAVDRGRVVATWTQKATTKKLTVTLSPLGGWRKSRHARQAAREARWIASHLGLGSSELVID